MEGQKIPPPDGQFTSSAICRCLSGQGRALGQKEPRSLPGSQALGRVREPALLHSWRCSYGGHKILETVSGAMICNWSQRSQPSKLATGKAQQSSWSAPGPASHPRKQPRRSPAWPPSAASWRRAGAPSPDSCPRAGAVHENVALKVRAAGLAPRAPRLAAGGAALA